MANFKAKDWVEIEDKALGLKAIGVIIGLCQDNNYNLYYQIQWKIVECKKTMGIVPTELYPVPDFDRKGTLAANAQVLYGQR